MSAFWVVLMAMFLEPAIVAIDPIAIGSAAEKTSAEIAARVMAPFYGYDADAPDNVHLATRQIAVVLINERTAEALSAAWPFQYGTQLQIYRRILSYQPRAVFADLLYQFDRSGDRRELDAMIERVALMGRRFTEAGKSGIVVSGAAAPTSGVGASVLGQAVQYAQRDALPVVQTNLEIGVVGMREVGSSYTLQGLHRGYDRGDGEVAPWPEARPTPSGALRLMEMHCLAGRDLIERNPETAAPLPPGCADLDTLLATPPGEPMRLYWGTLTQQTWEPTGDLSLEMADALAPTAEGDTRARQAALIAAANAEAVETGACLHFAPDLTGRLIESLRQVALSFKPLQDFQQDKICPYILTVPAEYLMTDQPEAQDYLRRALAGKSVIIGASVTGATDRIEVLSRSGIGVYAHAMALDNLLSYGARYLREASTISGEVFGFDLAWLKLQWDLMLELGVIFALVLLYFAIRGPLERFVVLSPRLQWLRRLLVSILWLLIAGAVTAASIVAALELLRWPPHNWIATIATAFIVTRLARRYDAAIASRTD